jgi:DNA polymerase II small subunit/DNA polymerase delta subunit B
MNELESVTSKICSAREILACAIDAQESGNANRTETLLYAVDEYLQYYLSEFDEKFQDAWKETVKKLKQQETLTCDENSSSPECKGAWNNFWEENYYPEEYKVPPLSGEHLQAKIQANSPYNDGFTREYYQEIVDKYEKKDKVVKWQLPVEEVKDCDTDETEYFITFPDDLLEAANLRAGDDVEWVDRGDGSFLLQKVTKPLGMDEC